METINTAFEPFKIYDLNNVAGIEKLPYTKKILVESLLRNKEKLNMPEEDWQYLLANISKKVDIPIMPTRVVMQDASGVPALVDLVSLRQHLMAEGVDPASINPEIPVDLVIDHSVQVDYFRSESAFDDNLNLEYARNEERYSFLRWAQQAFDGLSIVPPANGIIHQVNLEYLTKVIALNAESNIAFPELVIGTDSHTTMVNALGVLGWGVGGIEAEAAMLGIPVSMAMPDVVGVELIGRLREGVTATDIALTITEKLRKENVVGKFVEYFGESLQWLAIPDRSTISNMAPEYGATCGFFPVDEETLKFLKMTGKTEQEVNRVEQYCKQQGLFYEPKLDANREYQVRITIDLGKVEPSIAGPKRPQDRLALSEVKANFTPTKKAVVRQTSLTDGSLVIAAITSCTNTSNPYNMVAAGLLAKKAVEAGLNIASTIQTSLSPGSKVVTHYLQKAGLLPYLEKLGFYVTGYGCSVCVGNSGDLEKDVAEAIQKNDLTVAAVLSGNRNFEGRIHSLVKANYLASPPLVIAYALAGTMHIDITKEPIGFSVENEAVYLKDLWPNSKEIQAIIDETISADLFATAYADVFSGNEQWQNLQFEDQPIFNWNEKSTYFKASPFFEKSTDATIEHANVLLKLGDSITTDHISPVGQIAAHTSTGRYLKSIGVEAKDFNSYGSRRGNFEALVRGTFAHLRLKNELVEEIGGVTKYLPTGEQMDIYDAAELYQAQNTPLIILAGKEYGTGSARDWAAKGTYLLGVKSVIAESFERIHRSNLAMMGIVPIQFLPSDNAEKLGLDGTEKYTIPLGKLTPRQEVTVEVLKQDGSTFTFDAIVRLDTQLEIELYEKRGIFQSILHQWKSKAERV